MTLAEAMAEVAYNAFPTVLRTPTGMSHLSWAEMPEWQKREFIDAQKAALVALMLSGRAIVPFEPTGVMQVAGFETMDEDPAPDTKAIYQAMLMAAPKVVA